MAAGDVVNTGARLQMAAPMDSVLVDEPTRRATDRQVAFRVAAPVVQGQVRSRRSVGGTGARASQGVEVNQSSRARFVGRDIELQRLVDALRR